MVKRQSILPSFYRSAKRFAGAAASSYGYRIGTRLANRFGRSMTRTNQRRAVDRGNISRYHEDKVIYRRKRAPRRVRRRARKFFKKVEHCVNSLVETRTVVRSYVTTHSWTPSSVSNNQTVPAPLMLNGYTTGTASGNENIGDYYQISAVELSSGAIAAGAKMHVVSCTMDVMLQNVSENNVEVFVDIYYLVARKDNSVTESPSTTWFNEVANNAGAPVGGSAVTLNTSFGNTPFQCPGFCQMWLVKKKRRVYIEGGNTFHFQIRDPKNRTIDTQTFASESIYARKGITHGVMFVMWTNSFVPGQTYLQPGDVQIMCNKTYNYKIIAKESGASTRI